MVYVGLYTIVEYSSIFLFICLWCGPEAVLIFWLTAGVALLLLQYGPGQGFYEHSTSILLDIEPKEWTRKSDNYVIATLFLVSLTVLLNVGFVLCYGHIHREPVGEGQVEKMNGLRRQ